MYDAGLLEFSFVHELIWEYAQKITENPSYLNDLMQQLADSAPKLMSTKAGAKVVCVLATYSGAKERKRLVKSLKGKVMESLLHPSAHLAIMRIVDVTDDTVNVQKSLLDEIRSIEPIVKYKANGEILEKPLPALVTISKHYFGRKLILRLLNPSRRHLEPDEELLFSAEVSTSKKSADTRRTEHLVYLRHALLSVCTTFAEDLVTCKNGCKVLEEVVWTFRPASVLNAIISLFTGDKSDHTYDCAEIENNIQNDSVEDEASEEDFGDDANENFLSPDEEFSEYATTEKNEEIFEELYEEPSEDVDIPSTVEEESYVPIEENPHAQAVLKSILLLEAHSENPSIELSRRTTVDKRLWEEGKHDVALNLVSTLIKKSLVSQWLRHNRTCYALLDSLKVPSASAMIQEAITPYIEELKIYAKEHQGGRLLLERLDAMI